ncbi:type II toxin-antitoxin system Phd/YefM family antitoxin [Aureimonas frigidaquae]|uniref:type II toxin-antitoxin system Phd/YefM family antitoxin n=1 Tax=Aureimonas frigidaquae TaxID=424757 RepID=UPI000786071E|nr:type II toxin-antitoxin system Phd/YefM family antitoxin [Aureimonas frigidaquae]
MVTITAAELQSHLGHYWNLALREPVFITHHGRDSIVLLSADEYQRLRRYEPPQEPSAERKKELSERMETHRKTIEKLAQ